MSRHPAYIRNVRCMFVSIDEVPHGNAEYIKLLLTSYIAICRPSHMLSAKTAHDARYMSPMDPTSTQSAIPAPLPWHISSIGPSSTMSGCLTLFSTLCTEPNGIDHDFPAAPPAPCP